MEYEVIITRPALRDLEQIRTYIARSNPSAAGAFCSKLLDAAESLHTFPERGGAIAQRRGARFVVVYPYLVIYRIVEKSRKSARFAILARGARTGPNAVVTLNELGEEYTSRHSIIFMPTGLIYSGEVTGQRLGRLNGSGAVSLFKGNDQRWTNNPTTVSSFVIRASSLNSC